jgi:GxxExxY protein
MEIIFKEESYSIIGACFEVYNQLGAGFLEAVYQECLEIELTSRGVPFLARCPLELAYKERPLTQRYVPDLLCYGSIIVETKAARQLADEHRAQVHNYLKATGCRLGLLVNFGHHPQLEYERVVR